MKDGHTGYSAIVYIFIFFREVLSHIVQMIA